MTRDSDSGEFARCSAVTACSMFMNSKPEKGISRTRSDTHAAADDDRLLGHGQHDDRQVHARTADRLGDLQAVLAPGEQRIDDQHVRLLLADLLDHGRAVRDDIEQLHRRLRVEHATDVTRHLADILYEEQPDLRRCFGGTGHEPDYNKEQTRTARSLPASSGLRA